MEKNRFIKDGVLDMELVMQKFCEYFEELYADAIWNGRILSLIIKEYKVLLNLKSGMDKNIVDVERLNW